MTPDDLINLLNKLGISYTLHHHPPFFTVAEGLEFEKNIPGGHCRNLFVRDKRERMFLISALNETAIDLKKIAPMIGADRLSFGSPERLMRHLGVTPGSVCPFAAINDQDHQVNIVLDAGLMDHATVNFHPLLNTMTVGLAPRDLIKFFDHTGHKPHILDMRACAPDNLDHQE